MVARRGSLGLFFALVLITALLVKKYGLSYQRREADEAWQWGTAEKANISGITRTPERSRIGQQHFENVTSAKAERRLPDAIIIGAEKCGTGALLWFLNEHPLIKVPPAGEMFFFTREDYIHVLDNYRKHMPMVRKPELVIEKTPGYFKGLPVPMRIKTIVPDAKIILLLCDPVNRTYSDFLQHQKQGKIGQNQSFDALIETYVRNVKEKFRSLPDPVAIPLLLSYESGNNLEHIVSSGMYYYYVKHWLKTYKLHSDFLILDGEELLLRPWETFVTVQNFLNIPVLLTEKDFERSESGYFCVRKLAKSASQKDQFKCMGVSKGRSRLKSAEWSPEPLKKFFSATNKKLFKLIGRKFDWQ